MVVRQRQLKLMQKINKARWLQNRQSLFTVIGLVFTVIGLLLAVHSYRSGATKMDLEEVKDALDRLGDQDEVQSRPLIFIELTGRYLGYDERGNSILMYVLKNAGGVTARNIKKGHMIFKLSGGGSCKHYYEPVHKKDVLLPGQSSARHDDDIGVLDKGEIYKGQLIIAYDNPDDKTGKFYSLANLEFHPGETGKIYRIAQKTLGAVIVALVLNTVLVLS